MGRRWRSVRVRPWYGSVEVALARGVDATGARPVVSYLTHARTAEDVTHPLTLGLFSGVIDPRERERILCDAVIVPVTTDRWGQILDQGRADPRLEPRHPASVDPSESALSVAGV